MRPIIRWAGWMMAFPLIVVSSQAQHASGQLGLGVFASGVKLIGGETDDCAIGYTGGISLKYSFSQILTGEVTAGIGWVRPRDPDSHFKAMADAPYRTYLYPWNVSLRCNILPERRFNPYIGIGAGLTHWNLRDVSEEDNWFPIPASGTTISGNRKNLTAVGMVGAEVFLSSKFSLDLGFRYSRLFDQDLDNVGTGDVNNGMTEIRLSLHIYSGGFRDKDGDGIEDKHDGDPHRPEDYDGFQDEDGIPDLDNDEDGVPDKNDGAPNEAEDFDGFQDEDGIPDFDNDDDTIPDIRDKCPNEPETFNDYQDDDGCPDEKPMLPEKGKTLILPGVTFQSGRAALTGDAQQTLDKVDASLRDNTEIRLEIRGFTDSVGSAATNLNLSQRRAEAVKDYLVKKGIQFGRLRAIGYGEANPVAPNDTPEGRAKNRRIEFILIED